MTRLPRPSRRTVVEPTPIRPAKACVRRLDATGWQVSIHPASGGAERHTCSTIVDAARIIDVASVSSVHVWSAGAGRYVEVSPEALLPILDTARRPA
ncbi:hypothetical protein GCM10009623_20870 [Nocardioides aestuarii]|uniref:Uncharacterized protein n=1 Tax=Nocardioides aestuarii TaxID=252231 RepID=A0ABW4TNL8_9ACTN